MLSDDALRLSLADRGSAIVRVAAGDSSMLPHLVGGGRVAVGPPRDRPRAGDLLVYRQQDYLVVHRFLGFARSPDGRPCLRTRGDGRNRLDPPVLPESVAGRVTALERDGAWWSLDAGAAAIYSRLVVWHDLAWAAAGHVARYVGADAVAAALDRALLNAAAFALFRIAHRRVDAPGAAGPAATL